MQDIGRRERGGRDCRGYMKDMGEEKEKPRRRVGQESGLPRVCSAHAQNQE